MDARSRRANSPLPARPFACAARWPGRRCVVTAAPPFTVEIPELDDAAIEKLAELFLPLLDQFEKQDRNKRTPGGEVPTGRLR